MDWENEFRLKLEEKQQSKIDSGQKVKRLLDREKPGPTVDSNMQSIVMGSTPDALLIRSA